MSRSYALSLGALAMAMVVLRGAILGEPAVDVAKESIIAMVVFAGVGALAGWTADYLVREALESKFRGRVDWYRKGMIEAGFLEDDQSAEA